MWINHNDLQKRNNAQTMIVLIHTCTTNKGFSNTIKAQTVTISIRYVQQLTMAFQTSLKPKQGSFPYITCTTYNGLSNIIEARTGIIPIHYVHNLQWLFKHHWSPNRDHSHTLHAQLTMAFQTQLKPEQWSLPFITCTHISSFENAKNTCNNQHTQI